MDNTYALEQYIRAVLPNDLSADERLITMVKRHSTRHPYHIDSKTHTDLAMAQLDEDAKPDRDIYVALQKFDSTKWKNYPATYTDRDTGEQRPHFKAGQIKPDRTNNSVAGLKSFYLDIDANKKDLSKDMILAKLDEVFEDTGFFKAGLDYFAVDSGGGYHIYIPLTATVRPNEWQPLADRINDWLCPLVGADPGISNDTVRVLRMPRCHNKKQDADGKSKYGNPEVFVAREIAEQDGDTGDWILNDIADVSKWLQANSDAPIAKSSNLPVKATTAPTPVTDGTAQKVIDGCAIVQHHINSWREIHDAKGAKGPYDPRWQIITDAVLYSDDAEQALRHALPEYTDGIDRRHGPNRIADDLARKQKMGYKRSCNSMREDVKAELDDPCSSCRLKALCNSRPSDLALLMPPTRKHLPAGLTPVDEFKVALDYLGYQVRYNERADRIEWSKNGSPWDVMTEGLRAQLQTRDLYELTHDKNIRGKVQTVPYDLSEAKFSLYLIAAAFDNTVDPFKDYLDDLPDIAISDLEATWIEKPDIKVGTPPLQCDRIFTDLLGHDIEPDPENDLTAADELRWHAYVSRMLPLMAVFRTYNPACQCDEVVVIGGPQGLGKDTTIEHLLPQMQNQDFYTNSFSFKQSEKERLEATNGAVIVAASEMAGVTRSDDIESMKSWITRRKDKGRMAYRKDAGVFPRRFIVTCTTNSNQPLPKDPTGNRRWLVVQMQKERATMRVQDWFNEIVKDERFDRQMTRRDIIWAEAKALFKLSPDRDVVLPQYISAIQRAKNADYEHADERMEDAWTRFAEQRLKEDQPVMSSGVAVMLGFIDAPKDFVKAPKSLRHDIKALMESKGFKQINRTIPLDCGKVKGRAWVKEGHPLLEKKPVNANYNYDYYTGNMYATEPRINDYD